MKTLKLAITNNPDLSDAIRVYSSMFRMAYNRLQEGCSENEARKRLQNLFGVCSWLASSAAKEAHGVVTLNKGKKVLFGGKLNLKQYLKGLITKEQFRQKRLMPLCSIGESNYHGNRLFSFDFENNVVNYKPSRGIRKEIKFCPVKKKLAQELAKVQELADQKKMPVTVKFTDKYLFLTYDETLIYNEAYKGLEQNRVLGIDMNPNYIGVSVIEFDKNDEFKVLHKEVFDLTALTKPSGKASTHIKSKYFTNKLKHETLAIAHRINKLVDYWKCSKLAVEDLSMKPSDKQKGKTFNRLANNKWERQLFVNKLKMLAGIHRYELVEVNPAYSSIVGNFAYGNENTPDMVAASIEIARRAYKKFEKGWFYPRFNVETQDERWKQTLGGVKSWKDLFRKVKEAKLKYRFLLSDYFGNAVFSNFYNKRKWNYYIFV
ncbi:MAG: hypothetical protein IKT27_03860 [Clostridia bacterium]|nr:hypothetical protein [Clostridia bacterium]